jgi:hypothetical protein
MHRGVDISPTRWLLGSTFYRSDPLREVQDFLVLDLDLALAIRNIKIFGFRGTSQKKTALESTGVI